MRIRQLRALLQCKTNYLRRLVKEGKKIMARFTHVQYDSLTRGSLGAARTLAGDDAMRLSQSICLGGKKESRLCKEFAHGLLLCSKLVSGTPDRSLS